jgi:hypothetical protein
MRSIRNKVLKHYLRPDLITSIHRTQLQSWIEEITPVEGFIRNYDMYSPNIQGNIWTFYMKPQDLGRWWRTIPEDLFS